MFMKRMWDCNSRKMSAHMKKKKVCFTFTSFVIFTITQNIVNQFLMGSLSKCLWWTWFENVPPSMVKSNKTDQWQWRKSGASTGKQSGQFWLLWLYYDTSQLLIFAHGIMKEFEITQELAAMCSMKGPTSRSDLFTEVSACLEMLRLKWANWQVLQKMAVQICQEKMLDLWSGMNPKLVFSYFVFSQTGAVWVSAKN